MRRPLALLPLLGLLLLGPLPAGHAEGPTAPPAAGPTAATGVPAATVTFGVQPARAGRPDGRAWFSYEVDRGSLLADQLLVTNSSAGPVTLAVYGTDAFQSAEGGFDLLPADRPPTDVGSWVRTTSPTVTIPGRSRLAVPFTVVVPADATPGDHAGGVVASFVGGTTTARGDRLRVDQRVAARVYLRVRGELRPAVEVTGLATSYDHRWTPWAAGTLTTRWTIRNTGNVRVRVSDVLRLSSWLDDDSVAGLTGDEEVLVGQSVRGALTRSWRPSGRATATLSADPRLGEGELPLRVAGDTARAQAWAVPWALLGFSGGTLVLGCVALVLWRHRRAVRPAPARRAAADGRGASHPAYVP